MLYYLTDHTYLKKKLSAWGIKYLEGSYGLGILQRKGETVVVITYASDPEYCHHAMATKRYKLEDYDRLTKKWVPSTNSS